MLPDRIKLLVNKYPLGQCSEEEQNELFQWYDESSILEEKLEEKLEKEPELVDRLHDELLEGIKIEEKVRNPFIRKWVRMGSVAAGIFLVLGVTFWFSGTSKLITVYSYEKSERISLPDGSTVWLKPNSKLQYSKNMMKQHLREVSFEGEAFFQISHNPGKPFEVLTDDIKVRVLGTSFNVKSLAADSTTETTLFTGKVQLESLKDKSEHNRIALVPNQKAIYSRSRKSIEVNSIKNEMVTASKVKPGDIVVSMIFDDKPVLEVVKAVEKKFGVKVYFREQDLQDCHITVDLEKESLNEILELLQITQKISYSIYNDEIYLTGNMCKP